MNVVVDTNVLVSGVFWRGTPGKVLDHWTADRFQLLVTLEILDEYADTLAKVGKGDRDLPSLSRLSPVDVLTPKLFLERLDREDSL